MQGLRNSFKVLSRVTRGAPLKTIYPFQKITMARGNTLLYQSNGVFVNNQRYFSSEQKIDLFTGNINSCNEY